MSDGVLAKRPQFPNNDLDTLCEWLAAGGNSPPPVVELIAINAGVYAEHQGFPIFPPLELDAGDRVRLWWVIEGGVIEYQHAGTRWANDGAVPRRALLTLLSARRLLLETFGAPVLVAGVGVEPTISGL